MTMSFACSNGASFATTEATIAAARNEILERRSATRALVDQRLRSSGNGIVDDEIVAAPQQSARHVGTHPSQADHSELHGFSLVIRLLAGRSRAGALSRPVTSQLERLTLSVSFIARAKS
jgi:hypothetical protein